MKPAEHDSLRKFLVNLLNKKGSFIPFSDDQSLILSGRLDSLSVTQMILFLEQTYGLDLSQSIQSTTDLDSFTKITKIIEKSKNGV